MELKNILLKLTDNDKGSKEKVKKIKCNNSKIKFMKKLELISINGIMLLDILEAMNYDKKN